MADDLRSPMTSAFPGLSVDADVRDIHDQNPHPPQSRYPHEKGKDTLPLVFFEGEDRGKYMGPVDEIADDIVASPMSGQRRSATGEYESRRSVLGQKKR